MITVTILGNGNVAQHLFKALNASNEIEVIQWYSRKPETDFQVANTVSVVSELELLTQSDIYILAVSDDAVAKVSEMLPFENRFVVHCSGGLPLSVLSQKNRRGVFYPLQTFTINSNIDFNTVPVAIEAEEKTDLLCLKKLAHAITPKVNIFDSIQRKKIHLIAVVLNNFVNHLYHMAHEISKTEGISFELFYPLMQETLNKVSGMSPKNAQTGPAKRGDHSTVSTHIETLEKSFPEYIELYKSFTSSILKTYGRKEL